MIAGTFVVFRVFLWISWDFAALWLREISEAQEYTPKTGHNAVKMSQVFQDIAHFERFTDPNLFKYAFNVIQNWETNSLQFFSMVIIFC